MRRQTEMLYTIIPPEKIWVNNTLSEKVVLRKVNGLIVECTVNGNTAQVRRIISSSPRDYISNASIIGKVIKYTDK